MHLKYDHKKAIPKIYRLNSLKCSMQRHKYTKKSQSASASHSSNKVRRGSPATLGDPRPRDLREVIGVV